MTEQDDFVHGIERRAWDLAMEVHGNERYGEGLPYMVHLCSVADYFDNVVYRVIAILHDVVEATPPARREDLARRLASQFGSHITRTVAVLTRAPGETYVDYIKRVGQDPDARIVKMADLKSNLRFMEVFPEYRRLERRYRDAFSQLSTMAGVIFTRPEEDPPELNSNFGYVNN